ncbi:Probable lipoprotein precursor [Flavobacterium branchiophilum FL-15]|uniref:Lipoprotein n=3 Tax=Flavobacterium branchiophilum TaxID=55197 RepID=A0A2H3KQ11_9FLAO|nr:hypothetical protein B0A77_03155 [Flavobacterium branchiophilum]CCB69397.1 Probable lipoprotein precursor [Flavobacterium branchiophilum FL-15]
MIQIMNKNLIKIIGLFSGLALFFTSCASEDYTLGDLTNPSNLSITADVVGKTTANPNGDGTGVVNIVATANNVLAYKIAYKDVTNFTDTEEFVALPNGKVSKTFTSLGTHTYRITVVAYGAGGTSTSATKEVTVFSSFNPETSVVTFLTNDSSKTWVVDKSIPGHFGVGPWNTSSVTPEWWSAAINEKVNCCNCFYTTTFKFTKVSATNYTLQVTNPDGAFTKTGSLASIPGIPASGDEGCYSYSGGTTNFSFIPPSSGVSFSTMNLQTSIQLAGNTTYIGYGSLKKEYQIISISATAMYLRVQGTETGNAWYIKLKSI